MLVIPDHEMTGTVQMQVQSYVPPTLELPLTKVPSQPFGKSVSMLPGTALIYKPINISILVDRELKSWKEIFQWMLAIENYKSYKNQSFRAVSGLSMYIHVLDNLKENTVAIHEFVEPFPHLLYPPTFNHTAGSDYPMVMNVEFGYNMFNLLDANGHDVMPRMTLDDAREHSYLERRDEYIKSLT